MLPSEVLTTTGIKRYTLTEQIVEWLSARIITGEYPPNTPLTEVDLAETLGCSRSPLREALRVLAQEGLVELVPGKGATVSAFEPRLAAELYDTRALLESAAARLAVPVITLEKIAGLRSVLADLSAAAAKGDVASYHDINWLFHTELYNLCPNSTIVDLVRLIWRRTLRYGYLLRSDSLRLAASVARKTALMAAIEARDAGAAAELVAAIVVSGKGDVLEALTEGAVDPYGYWARKRAMPS